MNKQCEVCGKEFTQTQKRSRNKCGGCATRIRRAKAKLKGIELLGGKCNRCGFNGHPAALHFHHIDPTKKEFNIGPFCNKKWEIVEKEIRKCELLCANCHCIEHSTRYTKEFLNYVAKDRKQVLELSEKEVALINDKKLGMTYTELMSKYEIKSKSTINNIVNRRNKKVM